VRLWARAFDLYLFWLLASFLLLIFAKTSSMWLTFFVPAAWVLVEPWFLSRWGATPGKWFFRTKVRTCSEGGLSYADAFSRSLRVWWRGLGLGLTPISGLTMAIAYNDLTYRRVAPWDRQLGLRVVHDRIGPLRVLEAFFTVLLLIIALTIASVVVEGIAR
jgi:hypothetical protein